MRCAKGAVKPGGMCCTMRRGMEKSRGKRGRISWRALGPPVEVLNATMAGVHAEWRSEFMFSLSDREAFGGFLEQTAAGGEWRDRAAA
jgi:hypothetical protein